MITKTMLVQATVAVALVADSALSARTFTVYNNCPFTIWQVLPPAFYPTNLVLTWEFPTGPLYVYQGGLLLQYQMLMICICP